MQQRIVLVGVGGTGLSSLAYLFHDLGYTNLIGIDKNPSEITKKLEAYGISVIIGHGQYHVQQDDIVIYSDAAAQSPEVLAAHEKVGTNPKRVFPPFSYFQFLGEISKYCLTVSIAGTHGKSTTTALTGTVFARHHQDFGLALCGASVVERDNKNYIFNTDHQDDIKAIIDHILYPKGTILPDMKKYFFIVEADEYNRHFLCLDTDYALVTNIELDHADVYGDFDTYAKTFLQFLQGVRKKVFVLPQALGVQDSIGSIDSAKIELVTKKTFQFRTLLGAHNHDNASLVLAFAEKMLPGSSKVLENTLSQFAGLRRRGEIVGYNDHNVPIMSDYAHHPTELKSTLQAIQEKYGEDAFSSIHIIFQPHQARRVIEFWDTFVDILQAYDHVIIYKLYTARENLADLKKEFSTKPFLTHIDSFEALGQAFAQACDGVYITDFEKIEERIETYTGGLIVLFTAGDLDWKIRRNTEAKRSEEKGGRNREDKRSEENENIKKLKH